VFNFTDPETFWLNVTNIGLGLVTLLCCLAIGKGAFDAYRVRARMTARSRTEYDDHTFALPQLGLTMADGGERIDAPKDEAAKRKNPKAKK
jgi:hypothetical protein